MQSKQIFSGLRVLELASVLAGPGVGQFFAELGATVTKVEQPAGDVTRHWRVFTESTKNDVTAYFAAANWGKESVVLELTKAEDLEKLYELVREADIVIASYKPGDARKLKVDYESLRLLNPGLIYGQVSGYGQQSKKVGYDAVIQAEVGFMHMNGEPGSSPLKMPVALIDLLAAHQLKEALLLAMLHKAGTGEGSLVSVSLFDAAVASLANQATNWLCAGHNPQKMGSEHPNIVPYGSVFVTKDKRQIIFAIGSDKQFFQLCHLLGLEECSRFATNAQRVKHRAEVNKTVAEAVARFEQRDLLKLLEEANIPAGSVNDVMTVFGTPEAQKLILGEAGRVRGVRTMVAEAGFLPRVALKEPPHLSSGAFSE
jgi:crotonobetainyl-CoA:carnitine CoA-transferase CaiB-like acyl-CoA transferase